MASFTKCFKHRSCNPHNQSLMRKILLLSHFTAGKTAAQQFNVPRATGLGNGRVRVPTCISDFNPLVPDLWPTQPQPIRVTLMWRFLLSVSYRRIWRTHITSWAGDSLE